MSPEIKWKKIRLAFIPTFKGCATNNFFMTSLEIWQAIKQSLDLDFLKQA